MEKKATEKKPKAVTNEPAATIGRPQLSEEHLKAVNDWFSKYAEKGALPTNAYELNRYLAYDGVLNALVGFDEFMEKAPEAADWPEAKGLEEDLIDARDEVALMVAEFLALI